MVLPSRLLPQLVEIWIQKAAMASAGNAPPVSDSVSFCRWVELRRLV